MGPLTGKRKQASLTLVELPHCQENLVDRFPATQPRTPREAAPGGSFRSPVQTAQEGPHAHAHVGRVVSGKIIRATKHPLASLTL